MASSYTTRYSPGGFPIGHPANVQVIQRQNSEQGYVNFPAAIPHALEFGKGEVVEWLIEDKTTLILKRVQAPPVGKIDRTLLPSGSRVMTASWPSR